jgi:type IV pilus assembly protein PilB
MLWLIQGACVVATKRLGEVLIESGVLSLEQLQLALDKQLASRKRLGEQLLDMGLLSEEDLVVAMATHLDIPHVDLDDTPPDPDAVGRLTPELIRRHRALPMRVDGNRMAVAMLDPLNQNAIELISDATRLEVIPFITASSGLHAAFDRLLPPEPEPEAAEPEEAAVETARDEP